MNILIGFTLCLWSVAVVSVYGDTFTECNGVPIKTFVASLEGCAFYIYCDNQESYQEMCEDGMMFNVKEGICDLAENVDCSSNALTDTSTPFIQTTTAASLPPSTTNLFSPTPDSTLTPTSTFVPITTTDLLSTSTPTATSSSISTSTSSGQIQCPTPSRPEEISYLPNPTSCTDYYMCYRGTPIPMTCPENLEFNSMTGSCTWADYSNCKIATSTVSPKAKCTNTTSGYFDYPSNCHYYYRCTNGILIVQECPRGFGWDSERKQCNKDACPAQKS